jgi:prolyl oligopeptidase
VSHVSAVARLSGDDVLFRDESYLEPPAWYRFDSASGVLGKTALAKKTSIDLTDAEVVRESCVSADGTKVPLNIVQKRGAPRDGSGYAMLTGYGGFNISRSPRFRPITRLLLDQGFAVAEANLRGGGEFGDTWHEDGSVTKKQHVFDDFYACAKLLADEKVAPAAHLAIQGGSNGGLLMGAALVEHPEAYRVVVSHVGIYDMLNVETTSNGAFNVTEYGSVKDEAQFKALYAYSPYHHVTAGVAYPSVLFLTGANDPRVDPYNSRKMTARLQAATSGKSPILLRTSHDTGHGMGTPLAAQIDEDADVYAFMLHELGVAYRSPGKTAPE